MLGDFDTLGEKLEEAELLPLGDDDRLGEKLEDSELIARGGPQ